MKAKHYGWRPMGADHLFVYVICDGRLRKVGYSSRPEHRVSEISDQIRRPCRIEFVVSHPAELSCAVEVVAHRYLWTDRLIGEWFDVSVEQAKIAVVRALFLVDRTLPELFGDPSDCHFDLIGKRTGAALNASGFASLLHAAGSPVYRDLRALEGDERSDIRRDWLNRTSELSEDDIEKNWGIAREELLKAFGPRLEVG